MKMLPVYQKIINFIEGNVRNGDWPLHTRIPSESKLMEMFTTSRITVTRALKELELRGLIYRRQGKGTFAAEPKDGQHRIVSLIIPHSADFFSGGEQYIRSISKYCHGAGIFCSVHYSEQSSKKEREILNHLLAEKVSGIILYPISNRNIDLISAMVLRGDPFVLLDRKLAEIDCFAVEADNFNGAYEIVSYMIRMGHRKIVFISAMDSEAAKDRYRGYCKALMDSRIPIHPQLVIDHSSGHFLQDTQEILDPKTALRILEHLRSSATRFSAIFCVNDLTAFYLMKAAADMNIKIPEEFSIAGFDNLPFIRQLTTQLTTVEQDFDRIGKTCVKLLLEQIKKKAAGTETITVPTKLVIRDSVAALTDSSSIVPHQGIGRQPGAS